MKETDLRQLLDEKYKLYNNLQFIKTDPISIPHRFKLKQDIEISGFLTATIAWGQRISIIKNAKKMMQLMDDAPFDFILHHQPIDLKKISGFVHRTFNDTDFLTFIEALKNIYIHHHSLENLFVSPNGIKDGIVNFRNAFFTIPHLPRTQKHLANPLKKSSAKRINMFLRWMVRKDNSGVDFGIWKNINPCDLLLPLDVHTANVGRKLGLLTRKQNDWQAVEELTNNLRKFDANDPVKYDYALFGLGVFEKW